MRRLQLLIFAFCLSLAVNAQKSIVIYFSATGTTEAAAKKVAKAAKADIMEIVPAKEYSAADLDWHNKNSRSSLEMADKSSRPKIKAGAKSLSKYDTVYLGFPIWWGVAPRVINTFIETAQLDGKTIIPFATSGSSRIAGAVKELRSTYPQLQIKDGKLLNSPNDRAIEELVR